MTWSGTLADPQAAATEIVELLGYQARRMNARPKYMQSRLGARRCCAKQRQANDSSGRG